VLVPSVVVRPWVVTGSAPSTQVIVVPARLDLAADDPANVLKVTKALADETRLRMLRHLAGGEASLAELVAAVGVAKSTAHHHTVVLRDAGFIVSSFDDDRRYRLRTDQVEGVGRLVADFLAARPR
jgi:DNA-binding transcriptional ArsR family regulator